MFPLTDLPKAAVAYAKAKVRRSNVQLDVDGMDDIDASWYVKADMSILIQALTNLLSNALKYTPEGRVKLTIHFRRDLAAQTGVLAVVVQDTGRGLTAEELEKVMLPFAQIRKGADLLDGTGLGLPLTKLMIEKGHEGALTLESEGKGKGVTATMTVPLDWVDKAPTLPSSPLDFVTYDAHYGKDVLIVDDCRYNRRAIALVCNRVGLTFDQAEGGAEAVEKMASMPYALVSMDNQMPNMNGVDAAQQARQAGYVGTIVLVSGDVFQPCEEAAMRLKGLTAFLPKLRKPSIYDALKRLAELKKAVN